MKPSLTERYAACRALCDRSAPMTPEEIAEHRAAVARKAAEDDLKRQPVPQLQLPEVA